VASLPVEVDEAVDRVEEHNCVCQCEYLILLVQERKDGELEIYIQIQYHDQIYKEDEETAQAFAVLHCLSLGCSFLKEACYHEN
jgi:hypothetical protein